MRCHGWRVVAPDVYRRRKELEQISKALSFEKPDAIGVEQQNRRVRSQVYQDSEAASRFAMPKLGDDIHRIAEFVAGPIPAEHTKNPG